MEIILGTPDAHLGDVGQVEARFSLLGIVLIQVQVRCTVCDDRIIDSKIILDAPDGTPR
jgi:hypothetical protein